MNKSTKQALIIIAAGLTIHEIFYWLKAAVILQIGGELVAAIGGGMYAKYLGRKPIWGLLGFLGCIGILLLFMLVSEKIMVENKQPEQASAP